MKVVRFAGVRAKDRSKWWRKWKPGWMSLEPGERADGPRCTLPIFCGAEEEAGDLQDRGRGFAGVRSHESDVHFPLGVSAGWRTSVDSTVTTVWTSMWSSRAATLSRSIQLATLRHGPLACANSERSFPDSPPCGEADLHP